MKIREKYFCLFLTFRMFSHLNIGFCNNTLFFGVIRDNRYCYIEPAFVDGGVCP